MSTSELTKNKTRRRIRNTKQPSVDLRSLNEEEWTANTPSRNTDVSAPRFGGYMLVRSSSYLSTWRRRWFTLDGHYLQCFRDKESTSAIRTLYLAACDVKDRIEKLEFKIKPHHKRQYYELKLRDRSDFQAWFVVFQRAKEWKDPNEEGVVVVNNDTKGITRTSSFDSLSEVFDGETEHETVRGMSEVDVMREFAEMSREEFDAAHQHYHKKLVTELMTLQGHYTELEHSVKNGRNLEAETFMHTSRALLKAFTDFLNHLEGERDYWKKKYDKERQRAIDLEGSIRTLAKEHLQLEKAIPKGSMSSFHPPQHTDGDSDDDSDSEYFDAIAGGASVAEVVAPASASSPTSLVPKPTKSTEELAVGHTRTRSQSLLSGPSGNGAVFVRRDRLPCDRTNKRFSLWSMLKNNIGKDLSKIALPIVVNEPLSALQRCIEDLEYSDLLDKAANAQTSLERLAYIATFSISNYSTTMMRVNKPFNPILGETYELIRPERGRGLKLFAEQVSHHPPVSAMTANSLENLWEFHQTVLVGSSFRGKDMEIYPLGITHVYLTQLNEHYSWKKVTCCVRNIIVGRSWVDNYGSTVITNHTTGDTCELTFHPYSFFTGSVADVDGIIKDKSGQVHYKLRGKWTDSVRFAPADQNPSEGQLLWRKKPAPEWSSKQFDLSDFGMSLNEIEPDHVKFMPPTDCRFRPDQRLFEQGQVDEAQKEKDRLEEKQRAARRLKEARGEEYKPKFYELKFDPQLGRENWVSNGSYWRRRELHQWDDMPDLYSNEEQ